MIRYIATPIVKTVRKVKQAFSDYEQRQLDSKIAAILSDPLTPNTDVTEKLFDVLQKSYNGIPEYGYDDYSIWCRAADRSKTILGILPSQATSSSVYTLEVGCGDAMTSYLLSIFGINVTCNDMEDWRNKRCLHLPLMLGNTENGINAPDNHFDIIFSYNTFEHLQDPTVCMKEIVRICKPGGSIYLDFGPIYSSPWGLHAYRSLRMPYPQFLFSESFINMKLTELGISDLGKKRVALQPLNKWTILKYNTLWNSSNCIIRKQSTYKDRSHLKLVLKYPDAFRGRSLTIEDLTTSSIVIHLVKPS